jgi:hypothetical protein
MSSKSIGWKTSKRISKQLTLDPNGRVTITVLNETDEDIREIFILADVNQIIWTDISQTSNPQVTFVFKDDKKQAPIDVQFEHEDKCKLFLNKAQELDQASELKAGATRRDLFIVKQS